MDLNVDRAALASATYEEKWEHLKPLLAKLYLDYSWKVPKIKEFMQEEYDFRAEKHQYRYRFNKKWSWEKSLTTVKKGRLLEIGHKRAAEGRSTRIAHQGRKIRSDQLHRYVRERDKNMTLFMHAGTVIMPIFMTRSLLVQPIGFMGWRLPQQFIMQQLAITSHPSPFDAANTPPSDISIHTPPSTAAMSPGLIRAITCEMAQLNAERLMTGDFGALLRSLDGAGRRYMAKWMHQFWLFIFLSAKTWGRKPKTWTKTDIAYLTRHMESNAPTPNEVRDTTADTFNSGLEVPEPDPSHLLCKWTIHVSSSKWQYLNEANAHDDIELEAQLPSFESHLRNALSRDAFSTVPKEDLPVDLGRIHDIMIVSPLETFREALKFAIMSRNIELVDEMLLRMGKERLDIGPIKPLHLALTYLDGSRSCCRIFWGLLMSCGREPIHGVYGYGVRDVDDNGLSLFDTLMVHILRHHTTVSPEVLGTDFERFRLFGANEIDSCGRWDGDSRAYHQLMQNQSDIPSSWKHKFCNTSIQTVCHCIRELLHSARDASNGSLFLRRCFTCGEKMVPPPVHKVVLTAWHLAESGMASEDLFGMVCVLLCLAVAAAPTEYSDCNPGFHSTKLDLSLLLIGQSEAEGCCPSSHEDMWPSELARKLPLMTTTRIDVESARGWSVFCEIVSRLESQYRLALDRCSSDRSTMTGDDGSEEEDEDGSWRYAKVFFLDGEKSGARLPCGGFHEDIGRAFGLDKVLCHLWAMCQAELLTYRRRTLESPWNSSSLSMSVIENYLASGNAAELPFLGCNSLAKYCSCGHFSPPYFHSAARFDEVCLSAENSLDDGRYAAYLDDDEVEEE